VSILVLQTFDQTIFGELSFPGDTWFRTHKWYAIRRLGTREL